MRGSCPSPRGKPNDIRAEGDDPLAVLDAAHDADLRARLRSNPNRALLEGLAFDLHVDDRTTGVVEDRAPRHDHARPGRARWHRYAQQGTNAQPVIRRSAALRPRDKLVASASAV